MKHLLILLPLLLIGATASPSPEATSGGQVDLETIKENVKKRIESVVKGETAVNLEKVAAAYMGKVESLVSTSITIQTTAGVKQATTTPGTTILRIPGNKTVKFADISIDEYVTALGYLNPDGVLQTKRLLVQSDSPKSATTKAFFGTVIQYDAKTRALSLQNPATQESKQFIVSRKATIKNAELTDLAPNQMLLVVSTPGAEKDDDEVVINILAKPTVLGLTTQDTEATLSASAKTTTPPELKK